jgi:hypothetical protein
MATHNFGVIVPIKGIPRRRRSDPIGWSIELARGAAEKEDLELPGDPQVEEIQLTEAWGGPAIRVWWEWV